MATLNVHSQQINEDTPPHLTATPNFFQRALNPIVKNSILATIGLNVSAKVLNYYVHSLPKTYANIASCKAMTDLFTKTFGQSFAPKNTEPLSVLSYALSYLNPLEIYNVLKDLNEGEHALLQAAKNSTGLKKLFFDAASTPCRKAILDVKFANGLARTVLTIALLSAGTALALKACRSKQAQNT